MAIKLSDHFTSRRLIRFALPSIAMMVFTSIYCVVDGLFVSNFAGTDAFAALNIVIPIPVALSAVGFMFGTGGAALVAKTMGEGNQERADGLFSFIMWASGVISIVLTIISILLLEPFLQLLGAGGQLLEDGLVYGRIMLGGLIFAIMQNAFQSFFIAAEKPTTGLIVIVVAGVTNMVLDFVFIAILGWGIAGAGVATIIGQAFAAISPIFMFRKSRGYRLSFVKPIVDFRALGKASVNGSSELMTEVAASIVSTLYNYQLMMMVGPDGVAAYGVVMYMFFVFNAVFFGFSMGVGPVISFHYGAFNHDEMKSLFKRSMIMTGITGVIMFALSQLLAVPLVDIFVGYDPHLASITEHGLRIYSVSFLISGINIFGSAFFTALNNGKVSAFISFMRSLVFETSTVIILPMFFGAEGIWFAIIVAESCALIITALMMFLYSKKYHYA